MKTSLIITTYNSPGPLERVLQSVMHQTLLPGEVVIADDGSAEETGRIVRAFADKAPFVVLHEWQENRGFRAAMIRNKAVLRSTGDYIVLLDGDCIVNRHFISDHAANAEPGHFIQGKRILVSRKAVSSFDYRTANSAGELVKLALTGRITNIHHLARLPFFPVVKNRKLKGIKSCNMSFFRKDIEAVNGFNEDFVGWGNEDSELACRFFHYGLLKKVHPFMMVCFHLWHPSNKTVNTYNRQLLSASMASGSFFCRNGLLNHAATGRPDPSGQT